MRNLLFLLLLIAQPGEAQFGSARISSDRGSLLLAAQEKLVGDGGGAPLRSVFLRRDGIIRRLSVPADTPQGIDSYNSLQLSLDGAVAAYTAFATVRQGLFPATFVHYSQGVLHRLADGRKWTGLGEVRLSPNGVWAVSGRVSALAPSAVRWINTVTGEDNSHLDAATPGQSVADDGSVVLMEPGLIHLYRSGGKVTTFAASGVVGGGLITRDAASAYFTRIDHNTPELSQVFRLDIASGGEVLADSACRDPFLVGTSPGGRYLLYHCFDGRTRTERAYDSNTGELQTRENRGAGQQLLDDNLSALSLTSDGVEVFSPGAERELLLTQPASAVNHGWYWVPGSWAALKGQGLDRAKINLDGREIHPVFRSAGVTTFQIPADLPPSARDCWIEDPRSEFAPRWIGVEQAPQLVRVLTWHDFDPPLVSDSKEGSALAQDETSGLWLDHQTGALPGRTLRMWLYGVGSAAGSPAVQFENEADGSTIAAEVLEMIPDPDDPGLWRVRFLLPPQSGATRIRVRASESSAATIFMSLAN